MVCLLAAPWVQLSVSADNGLPHNALRHHWLMPISCHFRDCKALLVTSLTHVSGAIASVQTFTFSFKTTTCVHKLYWCPSVSSWIIPGCVASQYGNWTCCEPPQQAEVYSTFVTVAYGRSNGAIFNDLERPLTWFSRSRHCLTLNISEMDQRTAIVTMEGE